MDRAPYLYLCLSSYRNLCRSSCLAFASAATFALAFALGLALAGLVETTGLRQELELVVRGGKGLSGSGKNV